MNLNSIQEVNMSALWLSNRKKMLKLNYSLHHDQHPESTRQSLPFSQLKTQPEVYYESLLYIDLAHSRDDRPCAK